MGALILALSLLAAALSIALFSYRRQIKSICRQLAFIKENNSNMILTQEIPLAAVSELVNAVNELLEGQKVQTIQYKKKDADMKEIITNLSHDIRTPLTSLNGYFQLLSEAALQEDRKRYTAVIQERIQSLKEMLDELFTYAKLQNDDYQLECTPFIINEVICDTVLSFYDDFKKRGIEPEFHITEEPMTVLCNEAALKRILHNIVKNGMEHGQEHMDICLEREADTAVIRFANPYHPLESFKIDRIFERFYKADTARSHTSTGLGLFIAKELTEKMSGRIFASHINNIFEINIVFKINGGLYD